MGQSKRESFGERGNNRSRPPKEPKDQRKSSERARREYVEGLLERGEAAEEEGELAPGATHEIVEQRPGESPKVRRRRFSLS